MALYASQVLGLLVLLTGLLNLVWAFHGQAAKLIGITEFLAGVCIVPSVIWLIIVNFPKIRSCFALRQP
jgi:hypothetical protein